MDIANSRGWVRSLIVLLLPVLLAAGFAIVGTADGPLSI